MLYKANDESQVINFTFLHLYNEINTACTFKITWEIIHCYMFYIACMFLQCFKSTHHFKCRNSATFPACKYNFTLSFMCLELLITLGPLTGNIIWISFVVLECHTDILYILLSCRRCCPFPLEVTRLSGEHTVWEQVPGPLSSVTPVPLWQPGWVFHTVWLIHS